MTARCVRCERSWEISVLQRIGSEGYVCPYCEAQEHQKRAKVFSKTHPVTEKGTKGRRKRDIRRKRNADRYI